MKSVTLAESPYRIQEGRIVRTRQMTPMEKWFEISLAGGRPLDHEPGQFVMVSVPGVGEAPISVCSSPSRRSSNWWFGNSAE